MKKLIVLILVTICNIVALHAQTEQEFKIWEPVIEAIAKVESNRDSTLVSKSKIYVGYLQIAPCVVKEVNRCLGVNKYTLKDRYSKQKSKEMFILIQRKYNPTNNVQKAIRIWNGGPKGHTKRFTLSYYNRVMLHFDETAYAEY